MLPCSSNLSNLYKTNIYLLLIFSSVSIKCSNFDFAICEGMFLNKKLEYDKFIVSNRKNKVFIFKPINYNLLKLKMKNFFLVILIVIISYFYMLSNHLKYSPMHSKNTILEEGKKIITVLGDSNSHSTLGVSW